jgi:hypothetical protein
MATSSLTPPSVRFITYRLHQGEQNRVLRPWRPHSTYRISPVGAPQEVCAHTNPVAVAAAIPVGRAAWEARGVPATILEAHRRIYRRQCASYESWEVSSYY